MSAKAPAGNIYFVQPVARAAEVLAHIVAQPNRVTLAAVVRATAIPKTTAFRYLQTLVAAGLLQHDADTDSYGAGGRFTAIADRERDFRHLKQSATPEIERLARSFAETVNLAVLHESDVVYVDIREPRRSQRFGARIGGRHPLYSTSLGKAIASGMSLAAIDRILAPELPPCTLSTITNIAGFHRQVRQVRAVGYAIDAGETEDGVTCIGVPILDRDGRSVAAISLSAPQHRMAHLKDRAISALRAAAGRVSTTLAGS